MTFELQSIDPVRAAKIAALVYAGITGVFAIVLVPLALVIVLLGGTSSAGAAEFLVPFAIILVYPFIGAVMGGIVGWLGATIYNLVKRVTGGLILEFVQQTDGARAASPK